MALQNKAIDGVSRRREGAGAILIDNFGRFLLQQRDDCPGILQPGKVGLFGGHRESNETYLQCLVREINEEIGYSSRKSVLNTSQTMKVPILRLPGALSA